MLDLRERRVTLEEGVLQVPLEMTVLLYVNTILSESVLYIQCHVHVLCCFAFELACFFLPSFSQLSLKQVYNYIIIYIII